MVKISVVVPVYNCEKYLEQCIESVLSQTLKELEVICVDDGSTDQSASVIRCLMSGDARISLLQQENKGAGPARNLAMENARESILRFWMQMIIIWKRMPWKKCTMYVRQSRLLHVRVCSGG